MSSSSSPSSRRQQQMATLRGDAAQGSSSLAIRQQQPLRKKLSASSLLTRLSLKSILQKNNNASSTSDGQKTAKSGGGGLRLPGRLGKNSSKRRSNTLRSSMTDSTASGVDNEPNVLQWLEQTCPEDVLPSILAFCGPKTTSTLSRTNRHWNDIVKKESTWRTMCIDLYKWKEGEQPEPASWFAHYQQHPCIPVDYSTLAQALKLAAPTNSRSNLKQVRSLRILMRPGRYQLERSIQVQAPAGVELSIETMQLPANLYQKPRTPSPSNSLFGQELMEQARPIESQQQARRPYRRSSSNNSFLEFIRCAARPGAASTNEQEATERSESEAAADVADIFGTEEQPTTHATLILRTRRHNEPAFCVRQGQLSLKNVEIAHQSHGLDIWNGNAAIQVQPPLGADDETPQRLDPLPSATLVGCKVSSKSGRGIVNIDGGSVTITQCAIHDCAATGVYIGGPGSRATISDTDVLRNGVGNRTGSRRGGIARGHSGVYLEQGLARITNCNISENTLTGISAVSADNAILHLHDSSLVSNGTFQLELPSTGTNARDQSVLDNNQMASQGAGRVRSGLLPQDAAASTTTNEGETPATMRR